MKIKLIFIAAICAMLASCTKEDSNSATGSGSAQDAEKTVEFILASTPSQGNFIDQQFEFDVNGTKVSFKESEMTEITDKAALKQFPTLSESVDKAYVFMDGTKPTESVQYFKYTLGKLKKGQKVSSISRKAIVKSDRPTSPEFNFLDAFTILAGGKEALLLSSISFNKQIENTEEIITKYFNITFKNFSANYSYN